MALLRAAASTRRRQTAPDLTEVAPGLWRPATVADLPRRSTLQLKGPIVPVPQTLCGATIAELVMERQPDQVLVRETTSRYNCGTIMGRNRTRRRDDRNDSDDSPRPELSDFNSWKRRSRGPQYNRHTPGGDFARHA